MNLQTVKIQKTSKNLGPDDSNQSIYSLNDKVRLVSFLKAIQTNDSDINDETLTYVSALAGKVINSEENSVSLDLYLNYLNENYQELKDNNCTYKDLLLNADKHIVMKDFAKMTIGVKKVNCFTEPRDLPF